MGTLSPRNILRLEAWDDSSYAVHTLMPIAIRSLLILKHAKRDYIFLGCRSMRIHVFSATCCICWQDGRCRPAGGRNETGFHLYRDERVPVLIGCVPVALRGISFKRNLVSVLKPSPHLLRYKEACSRCSPWYFAGLVDKIITFARLYGKSINFARKKGKKIKR